MKKRIVVYGVLIFVIGTIWLYRIHGPTNGVSLANYDYIEPGMHADEVEKLMGGSNNNLVLRQGLPIRVANQGWVEHWRGDTIRITIYYDRESKVVEKEWEWLRHDWADRDWTASELLWPPNWFRVQKIRE